jgi:hypothetical protein
VDWTLFWEQHSETVWATLAAIVVTLVITWIFYRKAEKPKRLGYAVISKNEIIRAGDDERENLQVVYAGAEVKSPNITVVRIGNVGKQAIVDDDFRGDPVKIDFGDAIILSTTLTNQQNSGVSIHGMELSEESAVGVTPVFLNSGEWFDLRFVTDGDLVNPKVTARFIGETTSIMSARDMLRRRRRPASVILATVFIGMFAILLYALNASRSDYTFPTVAILMGLFALLGGILTTRALILASASLRGDDANLKWPKKAKSDKEREFARNARKHK